MIIFAFWNYSDEYVKDGLKEQSIRQIPEENVVGVWIKGHEGLLASGSVTIRATGTRLAFLL